MSQEDQTLHELCRRVAAGVPGAREEFSERVAPLMELLAKRSLASSHDSIRALGVRGAERSGKIARISERFCRSVIEKVRRQHRQPGAETCTVRPLWPTERGSAFR